MVMTIGVSLGIAIGATIGAATHSIEKWMAFGAAIGVLVTVGAESWQPKKRMKLRP
jgi:hypothetical protein